MAETEAVSAKSRYEQLAQDRQPYLDRARNCAKLTIPSLFPPAGSSGTSAFATPEQGMGARGVNNVASKLLLALFPPNSPFFKMAVDEITAGELTKQEGMKDEVDKALGMFVRRVMSDVEARALRADLYEYFRHLVVAGNGTLYVPETGRARFFRLDKYVARRDPEGTLLEWIGKEQIDRAALPEEIAGKIPEGSDSTSGTDNSSRETVDLYTCALLNDEGSYDVYQEAGGEMIPGTEGTYDPDVLPFIVGRFIKVDGEHYGRGHTEEYLGDLVALESFTKSIREFVAIASRINPVIDPASSIRPKQLQNAENGEVLSGEQGSVWYLQVERYNDFRVAKEMVNSLMESLSFAYMLNTAIQRPGERVTAEEIRYMARELEDTLGGVYSVQAVDLQLPLARILIDGLSRRGLLPELPREIVEPHVVTGMDALGRGNDLSNLLQWKAVLADTPAAADVNWANFASRAANSLNVETTGLIYTPEEKAQMQAAAQQQQMIEALGPQAVAQMGGIAKTAMQQETPTE